MHRVSLLVNRVQIASRAQWPRVAIDGQEPSHGVGTTAQGHLVNGGSTSTVVLRRERHGLAAGAVVAAAPRIGDERMPVEADVHFLNIDLLLVGRFDRGPLLAALRDDVFVLHDDAKFEDEDCLILEVQEPGLDLSSTLARLVKWARRSARATGAIIKARSRWRWRA